MAITVGLYGRVASRSSVFRSISFVQNVGFTSGPAATPKRQRQMLTIAQKAELLDMLKEGKRYAAVGRHYRRNESWVRCIKNRENNLRTAAAVSFTQNAKRVETGCSKTIVRMESALAIRGAVIQGEQSLRTSSC